MVRVRVTDRVKDTVSVRARISFGVRVRIRVTVRGGEG